MPYRRSWSFCATTVALALLALPASSFAASPVQTELPPLVTTPPPNSVSLASCFNYYQFNSVQVMLSSRLSHMNAGAPVAIDAYIHNQNSYPIVNATVYARVFRIRNVNDANGNDVVDSFPIVENLTLKAGEDRHVQFIWNIPTDAEAGQYRMATFVVQDDRFNFLGLTFTDDVTGPVMNFSIDSDATGAVSFDRASATIAGEAYHFVAFPPSLPSSTKDIPVSINAVNTSAVPYAGSIVWNLYYWDGTNPANQLDSKTEDFTIGAHASKTATYTVTDTTHSVYYLIATLTTKAGSKSITALRFVRPNINVPRIAAVEAQHYPLTPGSLAFMCVHSASDSYSKNVHVTLSVETLPLFGLFSIPLASTNYDGIVPGNLVALTLPIKQTLASFEIVATISQNGKLIDSVTIPYQCEDLGTCSPWVWPVTALVGLVLALLFIWLLIKNRRHLGQHSVNAPQAPIPPPKI